MRRLATMFSLAVIMAAIPAAQAADPVYSQPAGYCQLVGNAQLLSIPDNASLSTEVVRLMDHAVGVSQDARWVNSSRPVFVWASEAKAACGIAYGYLKTQHRDDEFLNKCECFHERMVQYMN